MIFASAVGGGTICLGSTPRRDWMSSIDFEYSFVSYSMSGTPVSMALSILDPRVVM